MNSRYAKIFTFEIVFVVAVERLPRVFFAGERRPRLELLDEGIPFSELLALRPFARYTYVEQAACVHFH